MIRKAWILSLQPLLRNRALTACDRCTVWKWSVGLAGEFPAGAGTRPCSALPVSARSPREGFPPPAPSSAAVSQVCAPRHAAAPVPLTALTERFSAWPM